jgi:hypothetical protein
MINKVASFDLAIEHWMHLGFDTRDCMIEDKWELIKWSQTALIFPHQYITLTKRTFAFKEGLIMN